MSERVVNPNHTHDHHQHGVGHHHAPQPQYPQQAYPQQQAMVPMGSLPTMPMVRVSDQNGQDAYVPLGQWEQMQRQQQVGGMGALPGVGGIGKWAVVIGLGFAGWWVYKKYFKGTQTEVFGGDRRERGSRRRSRSHMMAEFESFLKARESAREDDRDDEGDDEDDED
jgi:hypothetical protein